MTKFLKRIWCQIVGHKLYIQTSKDSLIAYCERRCGAYFVYQPMAKNEHGFEGRILGFR